MAKSKKLFEDWLDKTAISDAVLDQLEETDPELATFENAKTVWLDVLEHLHELIEQAITAKFYQ